MSKLCLYSVKIDINGETALINPSCVGLRQPYGSVVQAPLPYPGLASLIVDLLIFDPSSVQQFQKSLQHVVDWSRKMLFMSES